MSKFTDFFKWGTKPQEIKNVIPDMQNYPIPLGEGKNAQTGSYIYREPEMFGVTLSDWRRSVERAWSESDPNRIDLTDIYKAITSYDAQAIGAIGQRKAGTLQGNVAIYNEDGTVNEQATKLIKSPSGSTARWFKDFMSYSLDSIFWGFELVTINVVNGKPVVKKVPERNVIPNMNVILKDTTIGNSKSNMLDFTEGPLDLITCKISYTNDINDLGLLNGVAPYFFSKVLSNWKMHADKFGMLTRVLKTNSENKKKLTGSYKAMRNHMRANFLVIGDGDELTFEGDTRTSMDIYKDLNNYCDSNISKIIVGQTSTTDQKSFAGSANVHENILESIIRSDREFIESVVNDQLIPKLQLLNLIPNNVYFGISENIDVDLVEQAGIIKTLTDAGFRIDPEYIEKTFDLPLVDIDTQEHNQNTQE